MQYCSDSCMRSHKDAHKNDCENDITKSDWIPNWFAEDRTPEFIKEGTIVHPLTRRMSREACSWGNSPAMDVLDLNYNEGEESNRDLKALTGKACTPRCQV